MDLRGRRASIDRLHGPLGGARDADPREGRKARWERVEEGWGRMGRGGTWRAEEGLSPRGEDVLERTCGKDPRIRGGKRGIRGIPCDGPTRRTVRGDPRPRSPFASIRRTGTDLYTTPPLGFWFWGVGRGGVDDPVPESHPPPPVPTGPRPIHVDGMALEAGEGRAGCDGVDPSMGSMDEKREPHRGGRKDGHPSTLP
eukprot:scaffold461_cov321-Pavlova_lutheri.AAC.9